MIKVKATLAKINRYSCQIYR